MKMLDNFCILVVALTLAMVHAQDDQSGFISIDCGIAEGSNYTHVTTGITYVSDAGFIEGGVNGQIFPEYNLSALSVPFITLRSFPQNTRNCYTLRPKQGKNNTYLIRTTFYYGNYDSKDQPPQFDLYLGADFWKTVNISDSDVSYLHEIIHLALSDYIHICLVNTDLGDPFISSLELRLLDFSMDVPPSTSLDTYDRVNLGSNETVRSGFCILKHYNYQSSLLGSNGSRELNTHTHSFDKEHKDLTWFGPALTYVHGGN